MKSIYLFTTKVRMYWVLLPMALLLTLVMIFTSCELLGGTGKLPAHSCENWCIECGKCTDLDCTEDICSEKCDGHGAAPEQGGIGVNAEGKFDLGCVPEPDFNAADFDGYCVINNNVPFFTDAEKHSTECFERYSEFDSLNRVGVAFACVCKNTMPTEDRGGQSYKPTGWVQNSYSCISTQQLYNRAHLIAWSLAGENDTKENLATGTAYMNQHSMQIFENMVLNYLKSNKSTNKVLYRVTPVFNGDNLLCSGVLMEAYSLDDGGEDIQFCVFVYNVQEGVHLDYATGENRLATSSDSPYYGAGAGFGTGNGGNTGNAGGNTGNEGGNTNPDNGNNQGGDCEVTGVVTHLMTDVFGSDTITSTNDYVSDDNLITYSLVSNSVAYNKDGTYRVYQGKTSLLLAAKGISAMSFNGKGKDGGETTVSIRVSTDGANWKTLESIVVSAKADYSISFGGAYTYIEITSTGKQLQINSFTYTVSE